MMRRFAIVFALALTRCASGPETGVDEKVNLFPLMRYETRESPAGHTLDVLWPIYQHERDDEATRSHLVPLYWTEDEADGSTFLNLLVLFWRNESPQHSAWHLFPFLHFESGDRVDNAHVWPFYGRRTVRTPDEPTRTTHAVAWPLNEVETRDDGTSRWWLLGLDGLFAVARGHSNVNEFDAAASPNGLPRTQRSENLGIVTALEDSIALWHAREATTEVGDEVKRSSDRQFLKLLGIVHGYDDETRQDGTYRNRVLGIGDIPWLALATSYGREPSATDAGEHTTQFFPFWRSAQRADGTRASWFGTFLFGREVDDTDGAVATHVLWPLIASETRERGDDAGWHFRFLPFAWFTQRADAKLSVLPLWYRFDDAIEHQEFFIPFFGRHEKKDGSRTRTFVVPPLYVKTSEAERSLERTEVLWPLTKFESHTEGWTRRVFPLFSASREHKRDHLNVGLLFDRNASEVSSDWLLWPLWNRASAIGEGSRTSIAPILDLRHVFAPKVESDETAFLWPLASTSTKDGTTKTWFFPFYWHYDNGKNRSWLHVWPLFGTSTEGDYVEHSTVFPFFRLGANADGTHTESGFLWPIAGTKRVGDHKRSWLLWLWHDTEEPTGSRERNVLWPLFHSETEVNGTSFWHSLGWLLRSETWNDDKGNLISDDFRFGGFLYHSHAEPDRTTASVPFLYKFTRTGEDRELRLFHLIPVRW
ncbi:MAG: hypothetical protein IT459_15775 [Planctomycetes bacterium]|nr:hypothetical protein [Planctomycetota bacterium]